MVKNQLKKSKKRSQPLPDLIEALPAELFSRSCSFLPPASVATSSAVCKAWRTSILSNPILHNEVDLSLMGERVEPEKVIGHLERLSSLSLHKLLNVSLDLSCFFDDWEFNTERRHRDWEDTKCSQLLKVLSKSRNSLRELSICLDPVSLMDLQDLPELLIQQVMQRLSGFTSLNRLIVYTQCMSTFQIGSDESDRFLQLFNCREEPSETETGWTMVRDLMEEGQKLFGKETGFTMLLFPSAPSMENPRADRETHVFIKTLSESRFTLVELDLSYLKGSKETFDFAVSCPNLIHLGLKLHQNEELEGRTKLSVPSGMERKAELVKLWLETSGYEIIWNETMSDWIGKELTTIHISDLSEAEESSLIPSSLQVITSTTLKSFDTLEYITLIGLTGSPTEEMLKLEESSFSLLQLLTLNEVSSSVYSSFSNLDFPNLLEINIAVAEESNASGTQAAFDPLLNILNKCSSNLLSINFDYHNSKPPKLPNKKSDFSFIDVVELYLGSEDETVGRWLSKWSWPELKYLESSEKLRSEFLKKAPFLPVKKEDQERYGDRDLD